MSFSSMFISRSVILSRAGRPLAFQQGNGRSCHPESATNPSPFTTSSFKAPFTHYKRRGTEQLAASQHVKLLPTFPGRWPDEHLIGNLVVYDMFGCPVKNQLGIQSLSYDTQHQYLAQRTGHSK